jgi:hypothetical protein
VVSAGFIAGIVAGFVVGYAVALARVAWLGYTKTKASVPVLRKTAWTLIGAAFTKGGMVVGLGVVAVALAFWPK